MTLGLSIPCSEIDDLILSEIVTADRRYGDFASTHEALGVLREEIHELEHAIQANALESVRTEAIQIAAVATRLAYSLNAETTRRRSVK